VLGWFFLGRHFRIYCPNRSTAPAKPRRPDERPATPDLRAEHLVRRGLPARTHFEYPHRCRQSSAHPLHQFICHIVRGLHCGDGKTVDPVLHSGNHVGEYRRSREGTPGQTYGTQEVGSAPDHGVPVRYVAVCSPPFRDGSCRLPMGSERFCRGSGVGGHCDRPGLLHIHHRGRDDLERVSVPDTLIRSAPDASTVGKESHPAYSYLVEAKSH